MAIAKKQDDEIGREQHRLDGEIELIDQKIAKEEQRLFSGRRVQPKELSGLQAEVASLKKRKEGLEDQDLEVMEQKEIVGRDAGAADRRARASSRKRRPNSTRR